MRILNICGGRFVFVGRVFLGGKCKRMKDLSPKTLNCLVRLVAESASRTNIRLTTWEKPSTNDQVNIQTIPNPSFLQ